MSTRERRRETIRVIQDGKFVTKNVWAAGGLTQQSDVSISSLDADLGPDVKDETPIIDNFPGNVTEARRALKNSRGEPEGNIRHVWMSSRVNGDHFDVVGPKDGRPLVIHVGSGLPFLDVRSGNVIVMSGSNWGNSVTTHGDSQVVVIAGAGCKSRVTAEGNSKVIYDCTAEGVRGLAYADGNAEVEVWNADGTSEIASHNMHHPLATFDTDVAAKQHADQSARWDENLSPFMVNQRADARGEAAYAATR